VITDMSSVRDNWTRTDSDRIGSMLVDPETNVITFESLKAGAQLAGLKIKDEMITKMIAEVAMSGLSADDDDASIDSAELFKLLRQRNRPLHDVDLDE
jgi:hypothetical protein